MGKKNLTKTDFQRTKLKEFYDQLLSNTTKQAYLKFSQEIQLDVQQVYKWIWDKRNKSRIQEKKKKQGEDKKNSKKLIQKLTYKNFVIAIPRSKQGAIKFEVNESVSEQAREALIHEGWQLIRQRPMNLPLIEYQDSEANQIQEQQPNSSVSIQKMEYIEKERPENQVKRTIEPLIITINKDNKVFNNHSDSLPSQLPQKGSSSGFQKNEEFIYDSNQ